MNFNLITVDIIDVGTGDPIEVETKFTPYSILMGPKGYGDFCSNDGNGYPVMIEKLDGELRVIIWGDINKEDPTHIISLEGAKEDLRKKTLDTH